MNSNNTVSDRHGSTVITLPSDTEILITRVFDAPADLIFKAWTTPGLVKRWWGVDTSEWLVWTVLVQHSCQEHRDAHLASGMESGMQVSYDRLEHLVRQAA